MIRQRKRNSLQRKNRPQRSSRRSPPLEELPPEETLPEEEQPLEEEELRAPEDFYEEPEADEPDGELVRFDGSVRTYRTGDGEYTTVIGGYSGLYEREDGTVEEVDDTLIPLKEKREKEEPGEDEPQKASSSNAMPLRSISASSYLANAGGETDIQIPERITSARGIRIESGEDSMELIPSGGSFKRSLCEGNAIRFTDVYENIDYQYTVVGNTVKEDIILLEPSEKYEFTYQLKIPGLQAAKEDGRIVIYRDRKEEPVFLLDAPLMIDDDGETSSDLTMKLSGKKDRVTVTVKADEDWLEDEDRAYPVRIDPSPLVPSNELIMCTVSEGHPSSHYDWGSPSYVGYVDDSMKNCRVYIAVNMFDDANMQDILNSATNCLQATLEIHQQTDNSKGTSVFELGFPVVGWDANRVTWNSMPAVNPAPDRHIFAGSAGENQTLSFDFTEVMNAWIAKTEPQGGFMLKAQVEAGETTDPAYRMAAETFANTYNSAQGPKITVVWEGNLEEEAMDLEKTTIDVTPSIVSTKIGGYSVSGVLTNGKTQEGAKISWQLMEEASEEGKDSGETEGAEEFIYPDFQKAGLESDYDASLVSNWQAESGWTLDDLETDTIYYVSGTAEGYPLNEDGTADTEGEKITFTPEDSDTFLLYEVQQHDLVNRIARHYGVNPNTIARDNHLYKNQLAEADTILFIRGPKTAEPYSWQDNLTPLEEKLLENLLAGANVNCELGLEPVNLNTGNFYMTQEDFGIPELNGSFGITRSYNSSLPDYHNEFGYGWSSGLGDHLSILPDGTILYKRSDGKGIPFTKNGDTYEAPEGYAQTLTPLDSIEIDTATASDAEERDRNESGETGKDAKTDWPATETRVVTTEELLKEAEQRKLASGRSFAENLVTGLPRASSSDARKQSGEPDSEKEEKGSAIAPPACAGWKVTDTDGSTFVFDAQGFLQYHEDRQGRRTTFVYSDDYDLLQIKSPTGKILDITMDEKGRITEAGLPDGTQVSYEYDEDGNLVQYTNQAGDTRRYEYDDSHRMTAWYDENGTCVTANVYDGEGRVTKQTDGNGNTAVLTYADGCTTVTDNNGNITEYCYDSQYRTTRIVYPDGSELRYTYDENGYRSSETDELGNTTAYTYDRNGNLLTETRADGSRASFTYNEANQLLTATDYEGGTTAYTYDERGNLLTATDPEGNTVSLTYDGQSRLISMTDANGGTVTLQYDGAAVTSITDGEGHTAHFTYDAMNRLLTQTDGSGRTEKWTYNKNGWNLTETAGDGGTTVYEYSPAGEVLSITDPMGTETAFTYDPMHNILSGTDAKGNTLTYAYDGNYNRISETDALGRTTVYAYDGRNRLISVTDAKGQKISYILDAKGNQIAASDRRGNTVHTEYDSILGLPVLVTDAMGYESRYEYDRNGRLLRQTNPDGTTQAYEYDKNGRVIRMTAPNGLVTELGYDGNGNIVRLSDDETRVYTFTYNHNNQLTKARDPLGGETACVYDGAGNLLTFTDANGHSTRYRYDGASRLQEVIDALDGVTATDYDLNGRIVKSTDANGHSDEFYYSEIGEFLAQTDALGHVTAREYDPVGNVTKTTDALKGETRIVYDELNQPVALTDALDHEYQTAYDENGNLVRIQMPDGDTVTMEYDANNRIITSTDEAGVVTAYTYDEMGRVTKKKDNIGNTTLYGYDESGNLIWQSDTIGRTAFYEYDPFGRLVEQTDFGQTVTRYEYDALDRLTRVIQPDGTAYAYEYDPAGNLIKTTEPGEAVYIYAYDAINRVTSETNPLGAVTGYTYDAVGNLLSALDAEGAETSYAYDDTDRLTSVTNGRRNTELYEYDELSRLLSFTTPEGNKTEYRYDALGNVTKVKDPNGLITEYRYDVMGNLIEAISPKGAKTSYTYDKHDELTSETDPAGNTTVYEVDLNRLVTKLTQKNGGSYVYTYDPVHRLTGITTPLGLTRTFEYDPADNIIEDSDSLGRNSSYEYDVMHRMTKVRDPEGGITEFGYDIRGNQNAVTDALGYTWNYEYDLIDQLKASVDPEGKATEYAYNQVGRLISQTKPGERTTQYSYDPAYNLIGITDPKGYFYSYTYDKDDRLIGTKNPLGETTETVYDPGSRITDYTDRMGLSEHYAYDPHGNLLTFTGTSGLNTRFSYDILDNLTEVTLPSGLKTRYTYDEMGNVTAVEDTMGRVTGYTYDLEGNRTSLTNAEGRTEKWSYDAGGRLTSYTTNSGDTIRYDYNKLNNLVEKSYENAEDTVIVGKNGEPAAGQDEEAEKGVLYGYDALGQRVSMMDLTGESTYQYDGLGRITQVTNGSGQTVSYTYDGSDQLESITYPDGTSVHYRYDKNDNLTEVIGRDGESTTYEYDAINRITQIHRPNGISTYNTYNARDQIVTMKNTCDDCGWVVSQYDYTYDDRGFIIGEDAIESLYGYAWDDKHDGKHENGRHDDKYPHGGQHRNKHDKDGKDNYQIVETNRTFEYDEDGKLLKSTEKEENQGTYTYEYTYDDMGNRLSYTKKRNGTVQESAEYTYNLSNQPVHAKLYDGKKHTEMEYGYDADGNLVSENGTKGTDKVELSYYYTVENRLKAVYEKDNLLAAMAYDGDGNRTFQLSYNLHTDDDFKGNSGNGNGNNKDNTGSGNKGNNGKESGKEKTSISPEDALLSYQALTLSLEELLRPQEESKATASDAEEKRTENALLPETETREEADQIISLFKKKNENGNNGNNGDGGNGNHYGWDAASPSDAEEKPDQGNNGNGNGNKDKDKGNNGNKDKDKGNNGNGNTNNTGGSENQSGILMPEKPVSAIEQGLIDLIKTEGHQKNYELVEYVSDVNREYAEVLMEVNIDGEPDTAYAYGNERLTVERFTGWTGYYTYDPRGSVSGVTDADGGLWASYRYNATGKMTFGEPEYNNIYGYNAESYNPMLELQYLRARYYDVERGNFLTEDTYLGDISDPLTLNRYNYVKSNPLNYIDPSGFVSEYLTGPSYDPDDSWKANNYPLSQTGSERTEFPVPVVSGTEAVRELWGSVSKGVDHFLRELDQAIDIGTKYLKQIGKWMEEAVGASVVDVCGKVVEIGEEIGEVLVSFLAGMLMGIDNAFAIPTDVSDEIFSEHADAYNLGKILGRSGIIAVLSIMAGMFVGGVGAAAGATIVIGGAAVLVTTSAIAITWNALTQGHLTLAVSNEGSSSGKGNTSDEGKGNSDSKKNKIPDNDSTTGHIFRDAEGHIPDTPENRALLEDVANDPANFRGTDKYGNEWYTKIQSDGSQVWVESRNGNIFEGGVNNTPKPWNPETGLKKP